MIDPPKYLLNVEERKGDGFPEIVAVFASHFEVLVELFFDQRVVLHRDRVPHQVFLQSRGEKSSVVNRAVRNSRLNEISTIDRSAISRVN